MLENWNSYVDKVLRPAGLDKTPGALRELRRAFYAGAQGLMYTITMQLEDGEEATSNDMKLMDDLAAELMQFAADVKAGKYA